MQSSERYRDDLNKMRSEIENISDKLDALTVSKQETKDEGRLADPTNKTLIETVNWRFDKMYFFEGIVQDTR